MAEQGKITISVGVDSGQAIDGLKDLQDGLKDMGKTSGKAGGQVVDAFDEIDKAAKDSAKAVDKSTGTAQKAMKQTAKVAEQSGKQTKDALDQADTIDGLDGLKDKAGDLDSSLKGLGGAAGLVSPELERILFVTGELSGGIEHTSRLTSFFGGNLGSLLRVSGPVAIAVGGLALTYNKLSGDLQAAEERIDASNEAMREGIADAKAYESRIRSLRVRLGILSRAEGDLRDARDEATDLMGAQNQAYDEATNRASVFRMGLRRVQEAMGEVDRGAERVSVRVMQMADAQEQATIAAEGGVAEMVMTTQWSDTGARAQQKLIDLHREFSQALQQEERFRRQYNQSIEEKTALVQIDRAMASGEIDQMHEARDLIGQLSLETAQLVHARLESVIAMEETAAAADAEADAVERNSRANVEAASAESEADRKAEEAAKSLADARETAADKLADARGEAARIERDYARAIMEVNALQAEGAVSEEQMTELVLAAYKRRGEALEELGRKRDEDAEKEKLTIENYAAALMSLKDLTGSALAAMSQDIDQREAESLARAEGNLARQEEIRKEFDAQRAAELTRLFKANQATAIAGAVISGAQAAVAALAPVSSGGFGPKLGMIMAPIIAANTAAQIAMIAQQKPSFHQGGMIGGQGDQAITAQGGEAVLNRGAVASLGGAAGVDSLNAGAGGGGAVVVQMVYKQRVLDELVVDNLAKGGPLKRAINGAAKRGRRGRVGGLL